MNIEVRIIMEDVVKKMNMNMKYESAELYDFEWNV